MLKTSYTREYPGIYIGQVEDNVDPQHRGRCKIRVFSVHGNLTYPPSILPWAEPIVVTPVNDHRGSVNIPDKGDIVWVFFKGANRDFPVYIGGVYGKDEIHASPEIIDFYIEDKARISYLRAEQAYYIRLGDSLIKIGLDGVSIEGNTSISGNLHIEGDLSVSGTTTLNDLVITGSCNKE